MPEITTIKLGKSTVEFLSRLKIHPRQHYEEVILKLISENKDKKNPSKLPQSSGSITTIKLRKKTAALLNNMKIHPRQSYEEVVLKLISENEDARKKIMH